MLHLKNILVPIDFSENGKQALRYAVPFAKQFGAKITLLHVIEPTYYPMEYVYLADDTRDLAKIAKKKLSALSRKIGSGCFNEALVRVGSPFHEINSAGSELKSDLIIIATHGHTGLKHVVLGSTAERVVRHAPCPVLVVRSREHEFV